CAEEPAHLLRHAESSSWPSRELIERTDGRAKRTIPRGVRPRATESEREEPANLLGHDPMRRQLAARHRDEAVRVPEYRMIPGNVRFRFLRSAFSEEGTQACEGAYNVGRAKMGVREGRVHRL